MNYASTVSIPQAVSTVATNILNTTRPYTCRFNTASGKHCCNFVDSNRNNDSILNVSIPQAVSTVATCKRRKANTVPPTCFNTASGKHCCNLSGCFYPARKHSVVSIPQAVSTVATRMALTSSSKLRTVSIPQAVSTVATSI